MFDIRFPVVLNQLCFELYSSRVSMNSICIMHIIIPLGVQMSGEFGSPVKIIGEFGISSRAP